MGRSAGRLCHSPTRARRFPKADLIEYVRARLAHFKAPKAVVFTSLPKTSTGKVQKYELRKEAESLTFP